MQSARNNQDPRSRARYAGGINSTARRPAHEGCMDQSIATSAKYRPPGSCALGADGAMAGLGLRRARTLLISDHMRLEDAAFVYLLGSPAVCRFLAGLLQGRLLGTLVERPWAWAVATWGGGGLALIGGFIARFGALTVWIAAISRDRLRFHPWPIALLPFGVSDVWSLAQCLGSSFRRLPWYRLARSPHTGSQLMLRTAGGCAPFMSDQRRIRARSCASSLVGSRSPGLADVTIPPSMR